MLLGLLAAHVGMRGGAPYATSKAAVEGLAGVSRSTTRSAVNVLSLGCVDTERLGERLAGGAERARS